jgi:hypothetical protein
LIPPVTPSAPLAEAAQEQVDTLASHAEATPLHSSPPEPPPFDIDFDLNLDSVDHAHAAAADAEPAAEPDTPAATEAVAEVVEAEEVHGVMNAEATAIDGVEFVEHARVRTSGVAEDPHESAHAVEGTSVSNAEAADAEAATDEALADHEAGGEDTEVEEELADEPELYDGEIPGFVQRARRAERIGRILRVFMVCTSVLLLFAALGQATYSFRNQLAASYPQTKGLLVEACKTIGCRIELPAQPGAVSIESSELQPAADGKDTLVLNLLLRNHSASAQAWPNIELTLKDEGKVPVARRVLLPAQYLATPAAAAAGFAANSEQSIKVSFDVSPLKPTDFQVYLFYP